MTKSVPAKQPKKEVVDPLTQRIVTIIANQMILDEGEIHAASKLQEDLKCDSLDLVEIVMVVEEEFHVNIGDDVAEKFRTVGDVVKYLKRVM